MLPANVACWPQAAADGCSLFRRCRTSSRHRRADPRQAFMSTRPSWLRPTPEWPHVEIGAESHDQEICVVDAPSVRRTPGFRQPTDRKLIAGTTARIATAIDIQGFRTLASPRCLLERFRSLPILFHTPTAGRGEAGWLHALVVAAKHSLRTRGSN